MRERERERERERGFEYLHPCIRHYLVEDEIFIFWFNFS